jgi:hypothetical protein
MGNTRITEDPRIDPRIKAVLGAIDLGLALSDADSREQVLKEANTEQAIAVRDLVTRGRHRGASALARRNPVVVSPRSSATRTAGQQGDRDHDPDQDQEIRHEILFQDWPCLAAGSRGDGSSRR